MRRRIRFAIIAAVVLAVLIPTTAASAGGTGGPTVPLNVQGATGDYTNPQPKTQQLIGYAYADGNGNLQASTYDTAGNPTSLLTITATKFHGAILIVAHLAAGTTSIYSTYSLAKPQVGAFRGNGTIRSHGGGSTVTFLIPKGWKLEDLSVTADNTADPAPPALTGPAG